MTGRRDDCVLHFTRASDIKMRPVRWAWKDRLPLGALGLVGGREGIGKSIFVYTIAATVTRGTLPGTHYGTPQSVVVIATEDSWEHTIVPRLVAAGADLERVYRVEAITETHTGASVSLPRDLEELTRVIRVTDAVLVILDPLLSRLDSHLDTHRDADVRLALEPLAALADSTSVCLLGLIHVNKGTSNDPLTSLMASRAFAAVARAVLFVMKDPDDESLRLLGQPKNNLGQTDTLATLAFRIIGAKVADTAEGEVWTGKLEWAGESPRTIADALEATTESGGDRTATSEAADWLHDFLTEQSDQCADSAGIKREGAKAGHSVDSLKRARRRLQITTNSCGFPRRTFWSLPVGVLPSTLPTAPTTPTAPTVSGGRLSPPLTTLSASQLAQSEQLAQSDTAGQPAPTRGHRAN